VDFRHGFYFTQNSQRRKDERCTLRRLCGGGFSRSAVPSSKCPPPLVKSRFLTQRPFVHALRSPLCNGLAGVCEKRPFTLRCSCDQISRIVNRRVLAAAAAGSKRPSKHQNLATLLKGDPARARQRMKQQSFRERKAEARCQRHAQAKIHLEWLGVDLMPGDDKWGLGDTGLIRGDGQAHKAAF
jgi:hypothetical protein